MSGTSDSVLLYGYGNPGRGDDGLGPALVEAIAALDLPGTAVDANYQLTVEDAADIGAYAAVVFVDAALQGPEPFWFARIDDSTTHPDGDSAGLIGDMGWTSHSVSPVQVVALAHHLFGCRVGAYTLGIRGYDFGELDEGLSGRAKENLAQAIAFLREALVERNFDYYVQEFGQSAAGPVTGSPTWKASP
jgi:hydrogenase maturation protease